jgi:transcriptional regulator with XRE-family HTH domain
MSNKKDKNVPCPELPLGERLRYWRSRQSLTQAEIERRAGLAHNALSRIENGQVDPQFDTVTRIAEALGMSFEELQQRPIAVSRPPENSAAVDAIAARLHALPPQKRRQVTEAFLQLLKQFEE